MDPIKEYRNNKIGITLELYPNEGGQEGYRFAAYFLRDGHLEGSLVETNHKCPGNLIEDAIDWGVDRKSLGNPKDYILVR